ncbi:DUF6973 domain-containing protein [Paenibacillus sp. SYP-B4298]|uniref:DUF6973 domain-containing protein n=1 Tax=Paenibacillus sp. SYP-B4298 TaxID=2996034 RepID=UPI0022DD614B|nr:hypothetical protein [Paenibacillus sp. SYP-B4298]
MKRFISFILVAVMLLSIAPFTFGASSDVINADDLSKVRQAAEIAFAKNNYAIQRTSLNVDKAPILDEAPDFYQSIEGRSYEELTQEEKEKFVEIVQAAQVYYNSIVSSVETDSSVITPMYLESQLSKAIEAAIYVGFPTLSATDIIISFQNSNTARDIGVAYAQIMGYYDPNGVLQTWDNPADAYRHFAWNWLNTEQINANDARVFGDYHELAMAAADDANAQPSLSFDQKVTYGVARAFIIRSNTQASLSAFNSQWANDSVMDIYNNSQGRRYSLYNSHSDVGDAFYKAFFTDSALIGWTSNVNASVRSTAYSYWK